MSQKSAAELAEYAHSQLIDLAQMARAKGLTTLAYLIEVAALEAAHEIAARGHRVKR